MRRVASSRTRWLLLIALLFSAASSTGAPNLFVAAQHGGSEANVRAEKGMQPDRDDRAFAKLWLSLHDCNTDVYVANGEISSEYLRSRGYVSNEAPPNGYVIISVDERFEGLKVTSILLPTTWAIIALTVDAPVETVRSRLEKTRNIKFSRKGKRHFLRNRESRRFEIFPERNHSSSTVIQCDSEQQ